MGGDFWQETADHNNAVVRDIPVVGTIFDGYAQIGSGIEEQGVVGFSTEMYEGAAALYAEGRQLRAELEPAGPPTPPSTPPSPRTTTCGRSGNGLVALAR